MKYEINGLTKKIIEEKTHLIDRDDFNALFEEVVREYGYQECKKVFDILKIAEIECDINSIKSRFYIENRIKQIKCYNVGFGDSFLCKGKNEYGAKMLVDCGEQNSFKNLNVLSDIYNELLTAEEKNIMISHLHEDHYNGISLL